MKITQQLAQTVLEYAVLLSVVLAVVLVMGTYIKRSTQAGLRNAQDQINIGEGYFNIGQNGSSGPSDPVGNSYGNCFTKALYDQCMEALGEDGCDGVDTEEYPCRHCTHCCCRAYGETLLECIQPCIH